jgi:hypothetical protein
MTVGTANSQKYVYGVIGASHRPPDGEGIGGGSIATVVLDDLAALVSDVPDGQLEPDRDELMRHARVLERALEGGTVLPMRFGVVMPDEETVRRRLLADHRDGLAAQLAELDGKVELNVKAIYHEDVVLAEVVAESPEVARLREESRGKPDDATYYERIRLGELVSEAVDRKRAEDGRLLLTALEPLATAVEEGEPIHERMALNASFLVARDRLDAFDQAVEALGAEHDARMRFKYTGPLPPHSFVELSVEEA